MKAILKGALLFKEKSEGTVEVVWRKKDGTPVKNIVKEIRKPKTTQEHMKEEKPDEKRRRQQITEMK